MPQVNARRLAMTAAAAGGNGSARVALVTGAARGIGKAIALRLAADGLDVAVNDLDAMAGELNEVTDSIEKAGRRSLAVTADVTDADGIEAMVTRVADELGHLDVMVTNAGIAQILPLLEITPGGLGPSDDGERPRGIPVLPGGRSADDPPGQRGQDHRR